MRTISGASGTSVRHRPDARILLAKDVAATGRVALYGIYFDHDKADIKPESAPTLEEIAKFLRQLPKLAMFVVGHTDNVGAYDYNMDSRSAAQSPSWMR